MNFTELQNEAAKRMADKIMDRDQRRFEAACSAMQGILAVANGAHYSGQDIITQAIRYADHLLAELERTEKKS